jgi:hypothetical protein
MRRIAGASLVAGAAALLAGGRGPEASAGTVSLGKVRWEASSPGVEVGMASIRAAGEGRWTRIVLLRLDPASVRLELATHLDPTLSHGIWTIDDAPATALAAFNAGQFNTIWPWGWTVMDGIELRPPGVGPLSQAVVEDSAGRVRFIPPDSIPAARAAGGVRTAIQSYPSLLVGDAEIPAELTAPGSPVGISHRDARLALGQLRDGRLLVFLTRFDGIGEAGESIPFGLTLAETAELLRSAGAVRAVALDGGISAQLLIRGAAGGAHAWRAWRKVPLGILVHRRDNMNGR